ncbi:MAG: uracil phosphoribosyltransferase [Bacteroidetes bacterium]|nr:MAG: uracil phosphoribosyltransferase [Bacteroidota bacterium]
MVHNLGKKNSIFNQFLAEIRSLDVQEDRMRFRRNMERLGEIFAYEISKTLDYQTKEVTSPLGVSELPLINNYPILATILRAGLPLHQGMLNYFDHADNAFISAYRKHHKNGKFDIELEYVSSPDLDKKTLILVDPMLATGASMEVSYKSLMQFGKPKHTHIVAAIASLEGINYLKRKLNMNRVSIWVGAIDDELTAQSYIVPGLGDAGDLSFGEKLELD